MQKIYFPLNSQAFQANSVAQNMGFGIFSRLCNSQITYFKASSIFTIFRKPCDPYDAVICAHSLDLVQTKLQIRGSINDDSEIIFLISK